jgi:hypothetical protein
MLLEALNRSSLTWRDLEEAGLGRDAVFAGIALATNAGLAVFRVGPGFVERLDLPGEAQP